MKGAWVAGVTRGRLLLSRTIGAQHARAIAGCGSLQEAQAALAGSAYGERVTAGVDLQTAERGVADTLLWHLRILAGWLPGDGAELVRVLAGWFELANIDALLADSPPLFELGGLATAWPRIEQATTVKELADALTSSAWGDPGGRSPAEIALGLRVAWARRVREAIPEAGDWVAGAGALLLARTSLLGADREHERQLSRLPTIGGRGLGARSLDELREALPLQASWALGRAQQPEDLWLAELGWWDRVERDAIALLRGGSDKATVLAAVALLAVDAQRTARALRAAAQGGGPELLELVAGAGGRFDVAA